MKERNLAIITTIILLIIGIILGILSNYSGQVIQSLPSSYNQFNFYKSQLEINGLNIKETLDFKTGQPYHTLFRTFQSPITTKNNPYIGNSVIINSVTCQSGEPYFNINNYCYQKPDFTTANTCPPYTENNEYGCTFGAVYGFNQGQNYWISSDFSLNPDNLFYINGKYFIKFIAYGVNEHNPLAVGNNFNIIGDAIYKSQYPSNEYVIVYIPYNGNISKYNIIDLSDFEYGTDKTSSLTPASINILNYLKTIFIFLIPGILFFCSWLFFGKELRDDEVPDQLSQNPSERKPWEVAAFFNPPFGRIDKNFFSAILLDFFRRKIIDIQLMKNKTFFSNVDEVYIKINDYKNNDLDSIEKEFMEMLIDIRDNSSEKYKKGDYFNLKRASTSFSVSFDLKSSARIIQKDVKDVGKKYMHTGGLIFYSVSLIILIFLGNIFIQSGLFTFFNIIILIFIFGMFITKTSLLIKYKGDFYIEYKEWQAFKKWLKDSPAMKETKSKGVILWDEYLVYATALGVAKEVLKELKEEGLIDDKRYNFYTGVYVSSTTFAMSSGSSGGGGGFGGGGGGGVGGGGGGGR